MTSSQMDTMLHIINNLPIPCSLLDENNKILQCNLQMAALLGIRDPRNCAQISDLAPPFQPDGTDSLIKISEITAGLLQTGRPTTFDWLSMNPRTRETIPATATMLKIGLNTDTNLMPEGRSYILLTLQDKREHYKLQAEKTAQKLLQSLTSQIQKMETVAYVDELTALHTHRYFMENAQTIYQESNKNSEPIHILMLDIDHFKQINDTHGHMIGDEVLKITAARIRHMLRKGTIVARFGDEEFIVMLKSMTYEDAVRAAWRIQKSIEESSFRACGEHIDVTISIGLATNDPVINDISVNAAALNDAAAQNAGDYSLTDLIAMADEALHTAKRTGRNKVVEFNAIAAES